METAINQLMGNTSCIASSAPGAGAPIVNSDEKEGAPPAWSPTAELAEIAGVDSSMMSELLALFLSDSVARLRALTSAWDRSDFATLRAQAHSLKGSALQMGAGRFAAVCRQLELLDYPQTDRCEVLMSDIGDQFSLVRLAMEKYIAKSQ